MDPQKHDSGELRDWIIQKLESLEAIADEDVLADYIIALLRAETSEPLRRNYLCSNLEDFLKGSTESFVDQVLEAAYNKNNPPVQDPEEAQEYSDVPRPSAKTPSPESLEQRQKSPQRLGHVVTFSRLNDEVSNSRILRAEASPFAKSPQALREATIAPNILSNGYNSAYRACGLDAQGVQLSPAGMAMNRGKASHGVPIPPGESFAAGYSSNNYALEQCQNYESFGFCVWGDTCPYMHSSEPLVIHGKGAASNHLPFQDFLSAMHFDNININSIHEGTGPLTSRHDAQLGRRLGHDKRHLRRNRRGIGSVAMIIVDRIPTEKLSEAAIKEYFSAFGSIKEIRLQPNRHQAFVTYHERGAASRACSSPRAVFDNRFIRTRLGKRSSADVLDSSDKTHLRHGSDEVAIDKQAFEKRAAEAQRRLEEKRLQMSNLESKKQALNNRRQDLMERHQDERKKFIEQLSRQRKQPGPDQTGQEATSNDFTQALKAKLADLEKEAMVLGIDHKQLFGLESPFRGHGSGHLGRKHGSQTGNLELHERSWYNLDLRTATVRVSGFEWSSQVEEQLRRHLLRFEGFESLEPDIGNPDNKLVTFQNRLAAEKFYYASRTVPGLGKLDLAWEKARDEPEARVSVATVESRLEHDPDEFEYDVVEDNMKF